MLSISMHEYTGRVPPGQQAAKTRHPLYHHMSLSIYQDLYISLCFRLVMIPLEPSCMYIEWNSEVTAACIHASPSPGKEL